MGLILKKCTIEDLDTLIEVSRSTFIDAFEKDNDPTDFKNYLAKAFNKNQMRSELMNPNSSFYFMVIDDLGMVGYVKINRKDAQKEQFDINAIELERIYVMNEFQGQQIGQEAMSLVIDLSKAHGASSLWLGVWEKNVKAIEFYERHRFKKFGENPYLIGEDEQYDWMMRLDLV